MIIKQNKWQTFLCAVITLAVAVMFFCFVIFDIRKVPHDYNVWVDNAVRYWILKGLCLVCAIITAIATVWFFKQMFSKEPLIEICDEYFYDNSSAISLGKISWYDMELAYIKSGFLNIQLKNPDKYFQRKNWLQMLMIKANWRMGYGDVCISTERFKKHSEKFLDEFSKRKTIEQ